MNLVDFGRAQRSKLVGIGRSIGRIGPSWSDWAGLVEFGRVFGLNLVEFGRIWSSWVRVWSSSVQSGHVLAEFGRVRLDFCSSLVRICSSLVEFCRIRPILVEFGRMGSSAVNFNGLLASLVASCPGLCCLVMLPSKSRASCGLRGNPRRPQTTNKQIVFFLSRTRGVPYWGSAYHSLFHEEPVQNGFPDFERGLNCFVLFKIV